MSQEKEFADPSSSVSLGESVEVVSEGRQTSGQESLPQEIEPTQKSESKETEPQREGVTRRRLRLTIHWPVAAAIMLVIVLVRQLPWTTFTYPEAVNNAWVLAMHHLLMQHAQCGRDFSFTFGPLGLCYSKAFVPQTYSIVIAMWAVLALSHWFVCYSIAKKLFNNPLMALLWFAILIAPMAVFTDVFFLAPAALMIVCYFALDARTRISRETWFTAGLLGVVAAVKFTFFICNAFVLIFVAVDQMFRRRQFPTLAFVALATFLGSYALSAQKLHLVNQYISTSLDVSRGHSEAMCLGEPQALWLAGLYVASVAGFLVLLGARLFQGLRLWCILPLLATAGICFLAFKAAYVRQDLGHQVIAPTTLAYLLVLFLPVFLKQESWRWLRHLAVVLLVVATFSTIPLNLNVPFYVYPIYVGKILVFDSTQNIKRIVEYFGGNRRQLEKYNAFLEGLKGPHSELLSTLKGGADCYPIDCSIVLANAMEYSPRPVIQSYCAYTKLLLNQNVDHLIGDKAPEWLIWKDLNQPDNWYPTLNDSLSWLEFLRSYEPYENQKSNSDSNFQLLKKTNQRKKVETRMYSEATAQFGQSVEIGQPSASSLIWAEIEVAPTKQGKLQNLFFRTFPPVIHVVLKDGSTHSFKAPSELLRHGFILSPFLSKANDMRYLFSDEWQQSLSGKEVVSFSITDEFNYQQHEKFPIYENRYKIRLSAISR